SRDWSSDVCSSDLPDCADDGREAAATLHVDGIADRATLVPAPGGKGRLKLQVRALGTDAPVQWLLDGRWIARTEGGRPFLYDYAGAGAGRHVLSALADNGAWAQVRFRVAATGGRGGTAPDADGPGAGQGAGH